MSLRGLLVEWAVFVHNIETQPVAISSIQVILQENLIDESEIASSQ
jgi:hypothetical protein